MKYYTYASDVWTRPSARSKSTSVMASLRAVCSAHTIIIVNNYYKTDKILMVNNYNCINLLTKH